MKNKNRIIGVIVLIFAIAYPLIIKSLSPDHFNASGDFLTYIFSPIIGVLGILLLINLKSGVYYSRIIVGSIFIVSGLIKANDTLGFSYKLEEYFEPGALGWTFFEPYSLWIAILVCVAEVVLGLAVLFGAKFKLALVFITMLLVFFAFLTYYTAQCDPLSTYMVIENGVSVERPVQCVLDCGCFGDALKGSIGRSLTPWESFYKDFILLILTAFMFLGWRRIKLNNERRDKLILSFSMIVIAVFGGYVFGWWMPLSFSAIAFTVYLLVKRFYNKPLRVWVIAGLMTIQTGLFIFYTLNYLPVKDYRAYAIGNDLKELMMTSDDIQNKITEDKLVLLKPTYKNVIDSEINDLSKVISDTAVNRQDLLDSVSYLINSKYEDIAWAKADSFATDSMVRGNLLPPVYAVNYLLRNKKTGEDKEFSSLEYLEQKLWNDWNTVYKLKHNETGEIVKVLADNYDLEEWEKKNYKKVNPLTYKVKDGYEPKIPADFDFNNEQVNHDVLNSEEYLLLVITYKLDTSIKQDFSKINELYSYAKNNNIKFYAATSTDYLADAFKQKNNIEFNFEAGDEKILKTIVRSNPGVLLIRKGIVYGKWSNLSVPNVEKLKHYISKIDK